MRYSLLFGKTLKQPPNEAETTSHKLLIQAGFIDRQLAPGIYSLLPLGWRVYEKIENIIREEIKAIGGQEVFLPSLQPKELWEKTGRWETMDPPLFKLKDRHDRLFALGSTHEEVITDLVGRYVKSYKDLPLALFQIQPKFRDEMRSSGGLLRVREFVMKDLYSFHVSQEDLDTYYHQVIEAYKKIFTRCGFHTKIVEADPGTIGGSESHEFMMICETGEDKIVCCTKCEWAANVLKSNLEECPKCGAETDVTNSIENGHTFKLGTKYAEPLDAYFVDNDGQRKPIYMGCYGIGLGRLMATVVEDHHDGRGITWPDSLAPYNVYLIEIANETPGGLIVEEVYETLQKIGIGVLWDEREDVSVGEKFVDADLIGIPVRLVISEKTGQKIEWKRRDEEETELLTMEELIIRLKASPFPT